MSETSRAASANCARALNWLLACLIGLLAAWPAAAQEVALAPDEQAWIAAHPVVKVALLLNNPPYYMRGEDGRPAGYAIELLSLMAERAGLHFDYRWSTSVREIAHQIAVGEADFTPLAAATPEREAIALFPGPLLLVQLVTITRSDLPEFREPADFVGRRVAIAEGQVPGEMVERDFPGIDLIRYASVGEALRAVSTGEADVAVAWLQAALYHIEADLLANLRVHALAESARTSMGPAVSRHAPELSEILRRAMATLTVAERANAAQNWLPRGAAARWSPGRVELSQAEREWVDRAGYVRAGFDQDFAPFTRRTPLDHFEGLGADMLRLAIDKVGLRLAGQVGMPGGELAARALAGDIDIAVGLTPTAALRNDFEFVGPFTRAATVMVMRSGDARIWRLPDEIEPGARLGLVKGHFLAAQIQLRRPGVQIVEFPSQAEVLTSLAAGNVDAIVGNGAVIARIIEEQYIGRLRVMGVVLNAESPLYFAIPKGRSELTRLFDKGFTAITPGEAADIRRRWLLVSFAPGLTWPLLLPWVLSLGIALLAVFGVLWRSNRRLRSVHRAEADARVAAEAATAARGRFLAYLTHELRGNVSGIRSGAAMLCEGEAVMGDDPVRRARLAAAIEQSAGNLQALLETTLDHERTMVAGIQLQPRRCLPAEWWDATLAPWRLTAERKGLAWIEQPPVGAPELLIDADRLAQVLSNLVGNAVKFTDSGAVTVAARWDGAASLLVFRVTDNGPGLSAEERERLFQPYFQGLAGKQAGAGAGLGLAISKQIVDAMRGSIAVVPNDGCGAAFEVRVPVALPVAMPPVQDLPVAAEVSRLS